MRRKNIILVSVSLCMLMMMAGGKIQPPKYHIEWQQELNNLEEQGVSYRFLDNETIELTQDWSGFKRVKTLHEPDEEIIRAWIAHNSIPLLEIDPATIDTSKYTGWYTFWTMVPLSNDFGYPLIVGDVNNNGMPDIYGDYRGDESLDFETRVYEVDTNGNAIRRFDYVPRRGCSVQLTDVDKNGLQEVVFLFGDSSFFYEQPSQNMLPTQSKFAHSEGAAVGTYEWVIELDADSAVDFLYRGTVPDSGIKWRTVVAEYDPIMNNFQKVWSTQLWYPNGEGGIGGYDVGDYDGDGRMNFLASGLWGQVWVVENTGDNNYCVNWIDSIPFVNLFYQTSGDVDADGNSEFFVSATMSNGNWTTVYEADSNDHYSPTFLFHLLSGGSLDEPTLMTRDIDGDGKLEFIIFSGAYLYFFKSDGDNSYALWYLKKVNAKTSVQFYDFNRDGRTDFIISWKRVNALGHLILSADIYTASGVTDVVDDHVPTLPKEMQLQQNYPNPFNPKTNIRFRISDFGFVSLKIFDVFGREVTTLVSENKQPGEYVVEWNANDVSNGVYYYRLQAGTFTDVKKMLLLK
jgi:hypothetical protein